MTNQFSKNPDFGRVEQISLESSHSFIFNLIMQSGKK